jgi:hypothetical protein
MSFKLADLFESLLDTVPNSTAFVIFNVATGGRDEGGFGQVATALSPRASSGEELVPGSLRDFCRNHPAADKILRSAMCLANNQRSTAGYPAASMSAVCARTVSE